ncbi:hypothetical protein D3C80_1922770 [compost metagenome]
MRLAARPAIQNVSASGSELKCRSWLQLRSKDVSTTQYSLGVPYSAPISLLS